MIRPGIPPRVLLGYLLAGLLAWSVVWLLLLCAWAIG